MLKLHRQDRKPLRFSLPLLQFSFGPKLPTNFSIQIHLLALALPFLSFPSYDSISSSNSAQFLSIFSSATSVSWSRIPFLPPAPYLQFSSCLPPSMLLFPAQFLSGSAFPSGFSFLSLPRQFIPAPACSFFTSVITFLWLKFHSCPYN